MSDQPTASGASRSLRPTQATGLRIFDDLFESKGRCQWCLAQKRRYYNDFEEEVAKHLYQHGKSNILKARGHSLDEDGGIMVNSATSSPDPDTIYDVVPGKKVVRKHPFTGKCRLTPQYATLPEPRSVCQCGTIDYDLEHDVRPGYIIKECVENAADYLLDERGYDLDADQFDTDKSLEYTKHARSVDSLQREDRIVVATAIAAGLKFAPNPVGVNGRTPGDSATTTQPAD